MLGRAKHYDPEKDNADRKKALQMTGQGSAKNGDAAQA
jgi:hypothetical protein